MYVILTSKPGEFTTELVDGLTPVETYDYIFYGRKKAEYVIAELAGDVRVRIVDAVDPSIVNNVPSKFLEKFDSVESARTELGALTRFGNIDAQLVSR